MESSLSLPPLSPTLHKCDVALTSLRKITSGRLCLKNQGKGLCSLSCATAWGSFLRDFEATTDIKCEGLKKAIEAWNADIIDKGFKGGVTSPVSLEEGGRLADLCSGNEYNCPDNHCKRSFAALGEDGTSSSPKYSSLAPPADECPGFVIADGAYTLPFLTWHSLHHNYLENAIGCAGGLSNMSADAEHTTWYCCASWTGMQPSLTAAVFLTCPCIAFVTALISQLPPLLLRPPLLPLLIQLHLLLLLRFLPTQGVRASARMHEFRASAW